MVNAKMRGNDEHFLHRWVGEDSVERGELDYNQMLSIMMLRLMMLRFRLMYELIPFREQRWWWCLWLCWGWRNWPVPLRRSWWGSSWGRRGRRRRTSRCGSCDVNIAAPLTRREIFSSNCFEHVFVSSNESFWSSPKSKVCAQCEEKGKEGECITWVKLIFKMFSQYSSRRGCLPTNEM